MIKYNYRRFQGGEIQFRVYNAFAASVIPRMFTLTPYKIVYVCNDVNPLHIFNCTMNFLKTVVSLSNIRLESKTGISLNNYELRFLLGETVKAAERLTRLSDKSKIRISSSITAIIDVFVERDFVFMDRGALGIRGLKTLNN